MIRGFDCITYKDICWFPTQFYLDKMRKENETGKQPADLRKPIRDHRSGRYRQPLNSYLGSDLKNAMADTGKSVIEEIDFNSSNYADLIDSAYAY